MYILVEYVSYALALGWVNALGNREKEHEERQRLQACVML